ALLLKTALAAYRLRGLWRLLPLPCAHTTIPAALSGTTRSPDNPSGEIVIARSRIVAFIAILQPGTFPDAPASAPLPRAGGAQPHEFHQSAGRHRTDPPFAHGSSGSFAPSQACR